MQLHTCYACACLSIYACTYASKYLFYFPLIKIENILVKNM